MPTLHLGFGGVWGHRFCCSAAAIYISDVMDLLFLPPCLFVQVAINPKCISMTINRNIISELVKLHKDSQLGRREPIYDGRKSLYTAGALTFTSKVSMIKLPHNGGHRREREYKVTIRLVGLADLHHLQHFIRGRHMNAAQGTIQVLDVVLK